MFGSDGNTFLLARAVATAPISDAGVFAEAVEESEVSCRPVVAEDDNAAPLPSHCSAFAAMDGAHVIVDEKQLQCTTTPTSLSDIKDELRYHIDHQPNLLRGVETDTILEGLGYWWRCSEPWNDTNAIHASEEWQSRASRMYARSRAVPSLSRFLSHSWRANRKVKVAALFFFFNGDAALAAAWLAAMVAAVLQTCDAVPTWVYGARNEFLNALVPGGPEKIDLSLYAAVTFAMTYVLVLLTWHSFCGLVRRALAWFGCARLQVHNAAFLDKLCIHQWCESTKTLGIHSLGAYVMSSRKFTILWDPTYFTRLWCVFETAIYCKLCPEGEIEIVPIAIYCAACTMSVMNCVLFSCVYLPIYSTGLLDDMADLTGELTLSCATASMCLALAPFWVAPVAIICFSLRKYQRARIDLQKQLTSFSLKKAECLDGKDRDFVDTMVQQIYGSIDAFDQYVQTHVANLVEQQYPAAKMEFSLYQFHHFIGAMVSAIVLDSFSFFRHTDWAYRRGFAVGIIIFMNIQAPIVSKIMCTSSRMLWLDTKSLYSEFGVCIFLGMIVSPCTVLSMMGLPLTCSRDVGVQALMATLSIFLYCLVYRTESTKFITRLQSFLWHAILK